MVNAWDPSDEEIRHGENIPRDDQGQPADGPAPSQPPPQGMAGKRQKIEAFLGMAGLTLDDAVLVLAERMAPTIAAAVGEALRRAPQAAPPAAVAVAGPQAATMAQTAPGGAPGGMEALALGIAAKLFGLGGAPGGGDLGGALKSLTDVISAINGLENAILTKYQGVRNDARTEMIDFIRGSKGAGGDPFAALPGPGQAPPTSAAIGKALKAAGVHGA